jgi:serine/threonine protein phosphatase PrpC
MSTMTKASAAIQIEAACVSDPGRKRTENEDRYLVALDQAMFIVSDGMGGQQAGEVASQAVVEVLSDLLQRRLLMLPTANNRLIELVIREVVLEFNRSLLKETSGRMGLQGMGATLALVWIRQKQAIAHLASMGDSRIYLLRQGKLALLTEDHTIAAFLLKHGVITPTQAQNHPGQHKLSRYIGMEGEVYPDVQSIRLHPGDRLLLCSDGLSNMVNDEQIQALLAQNPHAQEACSALVQAANQAGGEDNITALVVNLSPMEFQSN